MPPAIALAKKPSGPPRTPKPMMTANPTARMAHGTTRTSSLPRGHRISSLVLGGTLSNVRGSPGDGGNHRGFGFRWGGTCDGEGNPSLDGLNLLCGAWVPGRECDRVPLSLGLALHKTSTANGRQVREALVELPSDRGFLFASGFALTPIDISKRLAVSVEHLVAAGYLLDRL